MLSSQKPRAAESPPHPPEKKGVGGRNASSACIPNNLLLCMANLFALSAVVCKTLIHEIWRIIWLLQQCFELGFL